MTAKRSRKGGVRRELHQNRILYLMCVPAFVLLLLFCYIPYISDYMAFTDFNVVDGIFGSPFVGLRNFKFFSAAVWRQRSFITPCTSTFST